MTDGSTLIDARSQAAALIALLRYTEGANRWRATVADVLEHGALEVLRAAVPADLLSDPLPSLLDRASKELEAWSHRAQVLTIYDDDYPAQLREVHDLPPVLFARGAIVDDRGVCLVGSRNASPSALAFTYDLASALAGEGVPVVSGLAAGIDTAAHTGALDASGRTVAVIGTGIDKSYPPQNKDLQRLIENRGLVLSQFWPGSSPTKRSFPMRNATMSAYGACTLVIAAGEQSGARTQAKQAIAHGRPLLLTKEVVGATTWAKDLARSAYDVTVVSTIDDALLAIGDVLDRPKRVPERLLDLAP